MLLVLFVLVIMHKVLLLKSDVSLVPTCLWFLDIQFAVGYGSACAVFCIVFSSKWVTYIHEIASSYWVFDSWQWNFSWKTPAIIGFYFIIIIIFFLVRILWTYRTSRPTRLTAIFSLEILEKNNDECILILVIYWKTTGLLHTKISNHNIIYSP
jgi:hypothetical protein